MANYTAEEEFENAYQEPYDNIQMPFTPEIVLSVKLLESRNITVSYFANLVGNPDPQFRVTCPKISEAELSNFQTHTANAEATSGTINETFKFVVPKELNSSESFPIHIDLCDGSVFSGAFLARHTIDGATIQLGGKPLLETVKFEKNGEIDVEIEKSYRTTPDFRYSLGLCPGEKEFRKKRIPIAQKAMKKILGIDQAPQSAAETPIVSLVCSGGGYRAVVGMCGAMEALSDAGLLDTITYSCGLSGSAWYLTAAYGLESAAPEKLWSFHEELKTPFEKSTKRNALNPMTYARYKTQIRKPRGIYGQPFAIADYLPGFLIGSELLGEKMNANLKELIPYVENATVPFPLFIALHVRNSIAAGKYHAYVERSPYEVYLPSYGIGLDPKTEGSVWNKGFIVRQCPEYPLQLTIAMVGVAFSILINNLNNQSEMPESFIDYKERKRAEGEEETTKELMEEVAKTSDIESSDENDEDEENGSKSTSLFSSLMTTVKKRVKNLASPRTALIVRTIKTFNFAYGVQDLKRHRLNPIGAINAPGPKEQEVINAVGVEDIKKVISNERKKISFADAGILFNVPTSPVLRPQRKTDVMIVMDFSAEESDSSFSYQGLMAAAAYAWRSGLKFPTIDFKEITQLPPKEFLIFPSDSADCPTVLWFTLSNEKFKNLEDYVPRSKENPPSGEKRKFNDFPVFDEGNFCSTFTFQYDKYNFDQLRELMYYNVTLHIEEIKAAIANATKLKQKSL